VEGTITVPRGEDVANDLKDVKIRNVDGQCAVRFYPYLYSVGCLRFKLLGAGGVLCVL